MKNRIIFFIASCMIFASFSACSDAVSDDTSFTEQPHTQAPASESNGEALNGSENTDSRSDTQAGADDAVSDSFYDKIFSDRGIEFSAVKFVGLNYAAFAYDDAVNGIIYRYEYGYDDSGIIKEIALTKYIDMTEMNEQEKNELSDEMDQLFQTYMMSGCEGMDFIFGEEYYELQMRMRDLENEYRLEALISAGLINEDDSFVFSERQAQLLSCGYVQK